MQQNLKPPPIYAYNIGIKGTIDLLIKNNIPKSKFLINIHDEKLVRIIANDLETYNSAITILKTKEIEFNTYTPRHLKPKSIVLKGIRGGFEETEITEEINSLNIPDVKLIKVTKMIFNRDTPERYNFIVT